MASDGTSPLLDISIYKKGDTSFALEPQDCKWQGGVKARMATIKASQVWDMVGDFCEYYKWSPSLDSSMLIQGLPNTEGCVRLCKSKQNNSQGEPLYVKEELLVLDSEKLFLSYRVVDSNVDLRDYDSTIQVLDCGSNGSEIEWLFQLSPVIGEDESQFVAFFALVMSERIQVLHQILSGKDPKDGS